MLTLTKEIDYSLVFLSYLLKQKNLVALSLVSKRTHLPLRFLARISSLLVKEGMVISREGKNGGYSLNKESLKISFYDFLKIFNQNLNFLPCYKRNCFCKKSCYHKKPFKKKIEEKFLNQLKKIKVKELLRD